MICLSPISCLSLSTRALVPAADSRLTLQTRQYVGSAQRRQQEIRRACLQQWKNIERIRVRRRDQQWAIRKGPLKRRKQRLHFCCLKRIERGDDYVGFATPAGFGLRSDSARYSNRENVKPLARCKQCLK